MGFTVSSPYDSTGNSCPLEPIHSTERPNQNTLSRSVGPHNGRGLQCLQFYNVHIYNIMDTNRNTNERKNKWRSPQEGDIGLGLLPVVPYRCPGVPAREGVSNLLCTFSYSIYTHLGPYLIKSSLSPTASLYSVFPKTNFRILLAHNYISDS